MNSLSFFNFASLAFAFSSVIVVCTEPLFRVSNKFNFYLFTKNNFFHYNPSELHIHSQNLFIATAFFLGLSVFFSLINLLAHLFEKEDETKTIKSIVCSSTIISTILYITSSSTLARTIYDIVDTIEHSPLPIPPIKDMDIVFKIGSIIGSFGIFSTILGLILISIQIHNDVSKRRYIELP
jgi:hypothetical protein